MFCKNIRCYAGYVRTFYGANNGSPARFVDEVCPDCGGDYKKGLETFEIPKRRKARRKKDEPIVLPF